MSRPGHKLDVDVIVVGGGLIGGTLAGLLAARAMNCIVVEKNPLSASAGADPRALAITRASARILEAAGTWRQVARDQIGYFRRMQVWDEHGDGDIEFDSAELCEPTLGYIVAQDVLEQAASLAHQDQVHIRRLQPAAPAGLRLDTERAILTLEDGKSITARLVVAADGANSRVRTLAGIACAAHDYQQQAVACIVTTELPHEDVARQRFMTDGPLAFLPMAGAHTCGIVWSTSPPRAEALLALAAPDFNGALAEAFSHRLGAVLDSGPRGGFPLRHAQAESYCLPRLALIGDAAHTVHPLAGQGANLGLLDAASLAEVIGDASAAGRDIGSLAVLRRYERWRRGENQLMLKTMQGFKVLFASPSPMVRCLRNTGMDLVDMITPLKHLIMRRASGLTGDLPHTARTGFGLPAHPG